MPRPKEDEKKKSKSKKVDTADVPESGKLKKPASKSKDADGSSKSRPTKDSSTGSLKGSSSKATNGKEAVKGPASGKTAAKTRAPLPPAKKADDYMADIDLPSSESEGELETTKKDQEEEPQEFRPHVSVSSGLQANTMREQRKLADRQRKLAEKAHRIKEDMLRDDDNVFDVAYEQQGEVDATVSATDIKVTPLSWLSSDQQHYTFACLCLQVHNMSVRAKGKLLLESTLLQVTAGRRYGLVGPNGKGKSTLLRLIARRQVPVPDGLDVLLVEQEVVGDDRSALQAVVAADTELMELREEEEEINAKLQDITLDDKTFDADEASERLNEVYERMQEINAASAEARASKILHGLGFTEVMQKRATHLFSGGWRMRISLARALYIQPTVLLLDEPTNHLDLRAVLWLEEYLQGHSEPQDIHYVCVQRWKKTLIVVSHDRDFLNTVTTDIIHLHDLKLHYYRGNFVQFEEMYDQKRREVGDCDIPSASSPGCVNKAADKYEKQMKAAKKSGSKAKQDKVTESTKFAQKKKQKGAPTPDDSNAAAEAPRRWSDYTVFFEFPEPTELQPPLIQLNDVSFKYPGREDFGLKNTWVFKCQSALMLLQDLNIGVDMGSRVAIVGPNGAGKTTLMNLLAGQCLLMAAALSVPQLCISPAHAGDLQPTDGDFRKSYKLRIGRYAQHFVDALEMDVNPIEYLLNKFPESGLKNEQMRAQLGRFGLSGHHHLQPICKLSGGQKARVVFTSISLSNPHILLFDERPHIFAVQPTNHLDLQSIDALADAIEQFEGGVIIISHDSQLLSRVCDDEERSEIWHVDDGQIERYDGYFSEYRDELIKEIQTELDED
eukprot:jgi/Astpho2/401/Aster-03451